MATTERKNRVKHGIRAPRKPKGELAKVTIANQDKQIKLLIDRVQEISEAREKILVEADISDGLAKDANRRVDDMRLVIERLQGWQDCAREMLGMMFSSAPGV